MQSFSIDLVAFAGGVTVGLLSVVLAHTRRSLRAAQETREEALREVLALEAILDARAVQLTAAKALSDEQAAYIATLEDASREALAHLDVLEAEILPDLNRIRASR